MKPHSDRPESYPRRILLAVTGLSPQIVTETLYALAVARKPAWIPTEIQVVTTKRGAENARLNLLSDKPGWFHRLRADYALPDIAFSGRDIHVMHRSDGEALDDIRNDADNMAAADFLTEHVRGLTADERASLHVSIAGGRKTMGFFLGYALSLFGRPQDRLSHVLVSSPFESRPDFYYPSPATRVLQAGKQTMDGEVWLGHIPFVRLRDGMPKQLLEGSARFSESVAQAQKALPPLSLSLDPGTRTVTAGGETFTLRPAEFAFYLMLAERRGNRMAGAHWSEKRLDNEIRDCYARVVNPHSGDYVRFEERGMSQENFNARKAHINKALKRALGERRAAPYLISALEPLAGKGRCRPYGLSVPAQAITVAASLQVRHPGGAKRHDAVTKAHDARRDHP